ncbi:DUF4367 domain-containing protein [Clostridium saccharobutylicum]|uniref:DUF4367 domain-containing protein n=1 Tax=Clostridium saccharobutylicum TaxID=169679 RepID=A0A1S8MQL2_CLOSA|nr:DUF4367 domain-containing protein [Clostridium saccharobutylicum]OOM06479.1 hypothetical protein CLOSAC_43990 [Clostridium saccharobutylicum]
MNKNNFHKNKENFIEGIQDEFQGFAAELSKIDFSEESNKEFVFQTILKKINYRRENKVNKIKKTGITAALLLIASTLIAQTTFAQDTVGKIIKRISLDHVTIIQSNDEDESKEVSVPDSLKGKVLDKNGNIITKLTKDMEKNGLYTTGGEKIYSLNPDNGTIITEKDAKEEEKKEDENNLYVTDSSKLNDYTCFDVKLPTYLPDGYEFDRAVLDRGEPNEEVKDSKYIDLQFKNKSNGKEIFMQERFACEETKTVEDLGNIKKISINGVDAILSDNNAIEWETNNTIYFLSGKNIGKDEAIKVAESIK